KRPGPGLQRSRGLLLALHLSIGYFQHLCTIATGVVHVKQQGLGGLAGISNGYWNLGALQISEQAAFRAEINLWLSHVELDPVGLVNWDHRTVVIGVVPAVAKDTVGDF